jgi:tetratricopeptide (TPR) repeat protein
MDALALLRTHRYAESISVCQKILVAKPNDIAAVDIMADSLRAIGRYADALPLFERVGAEEKACKVTPGHPGRQMPISCAYWCLGNHAQAVSLMHGLVKGILDGSIQYGDAAGGMSQGLLLYYMGVTARKPEETSYALDYMRNRLKRSLVQPWPCPVAQYYLGDISFEKVMEAVNRKRALPLDPTKVGLGRRRDLIVALFHDGIKNRAQGDEERCLVRMRECHALEDPLIEEEWYLARYEVETATRSSVTERMNEY